MAKYLIVDDEPLIRKGIIKLISRAAPEWELCGEAWDGEEGLEMAIQLHPDLILSDIRMPEMDGLTMAKQLIDQAISIPVVFLTGHDEFSYIQQAIKTNAFDYILKPFREEDVRELFERYQQEYGVKNKIQHKDMSILKQYEFFLMTTLESQNIEQLKSLEEWYKKLQSSINLRAFVELTTRNVHSFLLKFDIIGSEYKPVINEYNHDKVIQKLQEYCITQLKDVYSQNTNQLIETVKEWIDQHIDENLSLTEAASLVHLNSTYFSEYFKKYTGETFSQYVIRCKMERAKVLLSDHSLRVYDVAVNVGYSDQRHFSKVFHNKIGMTPSEYRNKLLGIKS